ncbi:MAG: DUF1592 domain-containing protein [Nannocystales bacterium]
MQIRSLLLGAAALFASGCYTGVDVSGTGVPSGGSDSFTTTAGGDGTGDSDSDDPVPDDYEPSPVALRRLVGSQYEASVRLLLGDEAAEAANPPADAAINGFTAVGAAQLALGSAEIDRYEASARDIAAAARTANAHQAYMDCEPIGPADDACMGEFVARFGRLAFRRSLDPDELDRYNAVGLTTAGDFDDFDAGIESTLAAMLQSPLFLYQVESGEATADADGQRRLRGTELATRVSFFLTGATPDAALLDAAEAGELDDNDGLRASAFALLEREEARGALGTFTEELLKLHELDGLPKDAVAFPTYDAELAEAMHEETRRFIEHVGFEGGDFSEMFDADYTFVNDVLAAHYGIPGEFGEEFVQVTLPPDQKRGGILGHASVMSVLAHVSSSSPTHRGKFVRETLLCTTIPAPPPGVSTDLPVGDGTETLRERLEVHMTDASCAGCHVLMDPIGFALESYDGVGAFRTLDNSKPIDDASELDGTPVSGAAEVGAVLRENEAAHACLVRNLYRHATGHIESDSELDALRDVTTAYIDSGYDLPTALVEIVGSPAFRLVGEPL